MIKEDISIFFKSEKRGIYLIPKLNSEVTVIVFHLKLSLNGFYLIDRSRFVKITVNTLGLNGLMNGLIGLFFKHFIQRIHLLTYRVFVCKMCKLRSGWNPCKPY